MAPRLRELHLYGGAALVAASAMLQQTRPPLRNFSVDVHDIEDAQTRQVGIATAAVETIVSNSATTLEYLGIQGHFPAFTLGVDLPVLRDFHTGGRCSSIVRAITAKSPALQTLVLQAGGSVDEVDEACIGSLRTLEFNSGAEIHADLGDIGRLRNLKTVTFSNQEVPDSVLAQLPDSVEDFAFEWRSPESTEDDVQTVLARLRTAGWSTSLRRIIIEVLELETYDFDEEEAVIATHRADMDALRTACDARKIEFEIRGPNLAKVRIRSRDPAQLAVR